MSELKDTLACKIGNNLLLKTKVSNLVHSSAARVEHYDSLLEMKQQEIMKLLDSIRLISSSSSDQTTPDDLLITDDRHHLGLEEETEEEEKEIEKVEQLPLLIPLTTADNNNNKNKDEKIEELERIVDELRKENNEFLEELVGLREVSASNAEEAVYARHNLDMALTELRAVLVGVDDDPERFYKFKQGLTVMMDEEAETATTQQHKIQSLQEKLDEAQEDAKEKDSIYENKLEKLQRYAGVIRNLAFDLISRLQGDDDENTSSLEKWCFEDMIEILNSQAHLLNEKGKSRAGALHESGFKEEHIMDRYEDGRVHSYRNGQDNNKQISGQGTCSDEVKVNIPGRQFKLDAGHYYKDVGTLPSGEGHVDEHGGDTFLGGGHNYDRDRPLLKRSVHL